MERKIDKMQKAIEKIEEALKELKEETGSGVNFVVSIMMDVDGKHTVNTRIDVCDDHHMMDIMSSITEGWWNANH